MVHDYIRSGLRQLAEVDADHAETAFASWRRRHMMSLSPRAWTRPGRSSPASWTFATPAQGYELRTPLDGLYKAQLTAEALAGARARFDERHAQIHGHAAKERPVELVSYRVRLRVPVPKYVAHTETAPSSPRPLKDAIKGTRTIHLDGKTSVQVTLYERERLDVGTSVAGPAIVEQFDATTVIPQGWTARVDGLRNLILERGT